MSNIHVEVSTIIDAPPERVYAVIADYRNHHPHILPRPYFVSLQVIKGGRGDGTEFVVEMSVYGAKRTFHMAVTEPEPGRVIAESDPEVGTHTTFTVESLEGGTKSKVTIATTSRAGAGIAGWLERLTTPGIMRKNLSRRVAAAEGIHETAGLA
jgi:uncharacterized protein YndB with AHSA1/START domain